MTLLDKVKSRIGGEKYQAISKFRILKTYKKLNDPIVQFLRQLRKYHMDVYFFGNRNKNSAYYSGAYNVLCDLFTDQNNQERFSFDKIYTPKIGDEKDIVAFLLEIADFLIYYLSEDTKLCDAVTNEGPYELGEVSIAYGDIVIDCGANIGLFSGMASMKGAAAVYAFEPNHQVIDNYLLKTAEWNPNIYICEYALSSKREKLRFKIYEHNIGASHISDVRGIENAEITEETTVQAISIDDFVQENNIPRVDFIKADIEGAERLMLMGAKQVLRDFAPKLAICTYHLPDDPKVLRELILDANQNYVIEKKFKKMYAHVPKGD